MLRLTAASVVAAGVSGKNCRRSYARREDKAINMTTTTMEQIVETRHIKNVKQIHRTTRYLVLLGAEWRLVIAGRRLPAAC